MATFPDASIKMMIATAGIVETAGTKSHLLPKAQLGLLNADTNTSVALGSGTTLANTPRLYVAQGSLYGTGAGNDQIGDYTTNSVGGAGRNPFHGGYAQSVRSRVIQPANIRRFYYVGPTDPAKNSIRVGIIGEQADFEANQSINGGPHAYLGADGVTPQNLAQDGALRRQEVYRLRLDLKGSPLLRALNHHFNYQFDASTKCMADGDIDLDDLAQQWADGINNHPIASKFVAAYAVAAGTASTTAVGASTSKTLVVASATGIKLGQVLSGTGVTLGTTVTGISGTSITVSKDLNTANSAALTFTGKPGVFIVDTTIETDFSADPVYSRTDFHEREGVVILASVLDEREMTCNSDLFETVTITEWKQGQGYGDKIRKELILEQEYQGNQWHDQDTRLRAILRDPVLSTIDDGKKYGFYILEYVIPRERNGSSQLDQDLVQLKIVLAGVNPGASVTRNSALESFIPYYAGLVNNPVKFENLTGLVN